MASPSRKQNGVMGIRMPITQLDALRERARQEGKTVSALGLELLEKALSLG